MVVRISLDVLLGICLFTTWVSMETEISTNKICHQLMKACLQKFDIFHENTTCRNLHEAIHCLNASDRALCTSTSEKTENYKSGQSEHGTPNDYKTHHSEGSFHSGTAYNDQSQTSMYPEGGARDDHMTQYENIQLSETEELMLSLVEIIEESKLEYTERCNEGDEVTWSAQVIFINLLIVFISSWDFQLHPYL